MVLSNLTVMLVGVASFDGAGICVVSALLAIGKKLWIDHAFPLFLRARFATR
jgi:hypothetical protein